MQKGNEILSEFKSNAIYRMDESTRMIKISLENFNDKTVWKKSNESTNSVANLMLHLCGNITQYIISSLGKTEDKRERDEEFSTKDGYTKKELLDILFKTVEKAKEVIRNTSEDKMTRKYDVQGYNFSGIGIIMHVVEHYSYHTGQIALWTKILKNKDLGFYDGVNLNTKNK